MDTGANCNIINKKIPFSSSKDFAPRHVKFANKTAETCRCSSISFAVDNLRFQGTFLIADIAEDIILGRPLLDSTGLLHLCITDSTAPNPFNTGLQCGSSIQIDHFDDTIGEGEEPQPECLLHEPAYDANTEDIWIGFAAQFNVTPSKLFQFMAWAATATKEKIANVFDNFHTLFPEMPPNFQFDRSDVDVPRSAHPNAPHKEVNKAVHTITNVFNTVWDIKRLGLCRLRSLRIIFNMLKFRPRKIKAQSLNEVMTEALTSELGVFIDAGLMEKVPLKDLEDGIITVSPLDLIAKPPSEGVARYRVITDMKRSGVNEAIEVINYPAPNMDEHLDFVSGKDLISIADALSFFWQLSLHPDSRNYCCVISKLGLLRYVAVPQGLNNAAPHCSQAVHESLMEELIHNIWKAYFDDFGNGVNFRDEPSQKFWDFLIAIAVFHMWALRYNVRFNPKHAYFGFTSAEFLGFTVSKAGKQVSASRTEALTNLECAHTKAAVGHLLGCFVFICKWIPHFAELAAPLYNLLKKGTRIDEAWTSACDDAIASLKECVTKAPILKAVNFLTHLFLRTDGSGIAIGGCMFQIVDLKELAAAYISKKLTAAQQEWPAVQIECFALVYVTRKWKPMYQGHPLIVVELDALNLVWAKSSTNDMIRRWLFEIEQLLRFATIRHIEGSRNQPSDALSRCHHFTCDDGNDDTLQLPHFRLCSAASAANLAKDVVRPKDAMNEDDLDISLLTRFPNNLEVIMTAEIQLLISLAHNDELGHAGTSGTLSVMRRANLHKHSCFTNLEHCTKCIITFIRGCPTCQLTWSILQSKYPCHEMVTHEYFRTIDVDFCYIGEDINGYCHVLGIRDRFTRYVEAFPTKTTTSAEFAVHLLAVGGRYGFFEEVCMDNAGYFTSECIDELLSLMGSKRKRISPYRPQANPMERSNKDILRNLRALCACRQEILSEWSSYLPIVLSIINSTFNAVTHCTPARMMYGDCVDRLRGILLPFGPKLRAELGPSFASKTSDAHAILMAEADALQQKRLAAALSKMPEYNPDKTYKQGEYVVAILPSESRKHKLAPQYRGLYLVVKTSGNNNSTVHCRCPVTDTIHSIQAQDLRLLDLRVLASSEEVTAWAAKLCNEPEYLVTDITDHRFSSTKVKEPLVDRDLTALEFKCFYKDGSFVWNPYAFISQLQQLETYIRIAKRHIPTKALNGNEFEDCVVPALKHFAKNFDVDITQSTTKQAIIVAIRAAILSRNV